MRSVGVITTARSDYGILLPILKTIAADPDLQLRLLVGGMHLAPEFGNTVQAIESDGFTVDDRIEMLVSSDTPLGTAKSIGLGVLGFAESYARIRPEILLAIGDRFEMFAAVSAALPMRIPVAHLHGGEVTVGAIDDSFRHAITKMSHLHFASTQEYAQRLERMGEEPWRITVSGAPSLDNLLAVDVLDLPALSARLGIALDEKPLLVTYHPVTTELDNVEAHTAELLEALDRFTRPIIITLPNADPGNRSITQALRAYEQAHSNAHIVTNLGTQLYFSMMRHAAVMIGNSSSGIIEAASFALPVVNIGSRQEGRTRARNVLDVPSEASAIAQGIERALDPSFVAGLAHISNPYGDGSAATKIVTRLRETPLDQRLLVKQFND